VRDYYNTTFLSPFQYVAVSTVCRCSEVSHPGLAANAGRTPIYDGSLTGRQALFGVKMHRGWHWTCERNRTLGLKFIKDECAIQVAA